jgi:hypothetical protein
VGLFAGTPPELNGECRPKGRHSFGALWLPNYLRRDATALRSKLLLSMWNITSSFLKDSDGMKRRTALTLPVSHKQNRMSIGGFPALQSHQQAQHGHAAQFCHTMTPSDVF